jgi:hypothetical protein
MSSPWFPLSTLLLPPVAVANGWQGTPPIDFCHPPCHRGFATQPREGATSRNQKRRPAVARPALPVRRSLLPGVVLRQRQGPAQACGAPASHRPALERPHDRPRARVHNLDPRLPSQRRERRIVGLGHGTLAGPERMVLAGRPRPVQAAIRTSATVEAEEHDPLRLGLEREVERERGRCRPRPGPRTRRPAGQSPRMAGRASISDTERPA